MEIWGLHNTSTFELIEAIENCAVTPGPKAVAARRGPGKRLDVGKREARNKLRPDEGSIMVEWGPYQGVHPTMMD